ncbi:unnamed protein product [Ectocarpus sp. 8 AP-2014]
MLTAAGGKAGAWEGGRRGGISCGQAREVTRGLVIELRRQSANSGMDAPWVVRFSLACTTISSWLRSVKVSSL